jgi:hypothetical protein
VKLRIAAVCCWMLALAPMGGTWGAASSPALDASGWWNKAQALPVEGDPSGLGAPTPEVPAPATVPEDGLYVSNDASGPAAIAAVRYRLGAAADGTLTLHLAEGGALTGAEELAACPVDGGFEGAQNGRWDAKPGYDEKACTVVGAPTEAKDGFTFAVPSAWSSSLGDVSIAIVPKPGSAAPFSIAFAKPTDGDFAAAGGSSSSGSSVSGTFTPSPSSSSSGGSSFSASRPSSSSFATPSTPGAVTPPTTTATTVASGEVASGAPVAASTIDEGTGAAKIVAMALLVGIGGALWFLSTRPQRAPRLLGSIGAGGAGGEKSQVSEPVTAV